MRDHGASLGLSLDLTLKQYGGRGLDPLVSAFKAESGATDTSGLNALIKYVRGEGLINNFVIYPMKSAQNAGSGSTVYGLGGLTALDATLVNSPTWGATGITFNGTTQYGMLTDFLATETLTVFQRMASSYAAADNLDTLLSQWDTGANDRSWSMEWNGAGGGSLLLNRSLDGGAVNFESYSTPKANFDNLDVCAVAQWIDGGTRACWSNKVSESLSLEAGSAQTARKNSAAKIGIMCGFTSGTAQRYAPGLVKSSAFLTGTVTTTQRETITDFINAL